MPTAAKLVAAICFALLGLLTAAVLRETLPETQREGYLFPGAVLAGVLCGWRVSGSAPRAGYLEAASTGLRTTVIAVIVDLGAFPIGTLW